MSKNSKEKSRRKKKILIVDDDKGILLSFSKALKETEKFEVDTFQDAEIALEKFKPKYYDLLLLDILMPKMNGFELYYQLQKRKLMDKEKICFITGHEVYYETLKKDFPRLKIGCFIKKPIRTDELVKKIEDELTI